MSAVLKKAVQSYQGGDFPRALTQLKEVLVSAAMRSQEVYSLLGNTHLRLGQTREAAGAFALGARLPGANAALLAKFAMGLFARSKDRAALIAFGDRALELHPEDSALAFDYASALFADGQYGRAAILGPRLDSANPHHQALRINCLRIIRDVAGLLDFLGDVLAREPDNAMIATTRFVVAREIADMPVISEQDRLMAEPHSAAADSVRAAEPAMARLLWSPDDRTNALPSVDSANVAALPMATARRTMSPPGTRLKIGYLSADFMEHATMRLFDEVLALHDRDAFEITLLCYTEPHQTGWQGRNFPPDVLSRIVPVGALTDAEAAEAIAARDIDILVDLKGHTMNARLGIARLSDAPLKVTYLGYPGSVTGAGFDYALTDPVVTPDEAVPFFEEKLCRLSECYQANGSARRPLPSAMTRAEAGLPEQGFVLASFNAVQKITPQALALWARVLDRIPQSLLWIYAPMETARHNLLVALERLGVGAARVHFAGAVGYQDHIARLGAADLGLDTFPYNGHTTTSDLLWAGLPVLTLKGHAFQARVSESLLKAAGLDGLVAVDDTSFVDLAATLAEDPARLADLRSSLETSRFRLPLFDTPRLTAHLEDAYRLMAERARSGQLPALIDVPARPPREGAFLERVRG